MLRVCPVSWQRPFCIERKHHDDDIKTKIKVDYSSAVNYDYDKLHE